MDDYPYAVLGADGWLRCDGLHCPDFPTLLRDMVHHFNYMWGPAYHGRMYRERCEVHMDVSAHPSDSSMMTWFTTATGDDLSDTLERAAYRALTEFCKRHLPGLASTVVALFLVRDEGGLMWSECLAAAFDPALLSYHAGWAFMARYAQHVNSLPQEFIAVGAHHCLRLEEYDHKVEIKDCLITDVRKGNRDLLQQNHRLKMRVKELNDELVRMYRSHDPMPSTAPVYSCSTHRMS
jgi:hypothetical protein